MHFSYVRAQKVAAALYAKFFSRRAQQANYYKNCTFESTWYTIYISRTSHCTPSVPSHPNLVLSVPSHPIPSHTVPSHPVAYLRRLFCFWCQSKKECLEEVESALSAATADDSADENDESSNKKQRVLKVRHTAHTAYRYSRKWYIIG